MELRSFAFAHHKFWIDRRSYYKMKEFLQPAKLFFGQASLLENFAKGSRRQCAGMHRYISLSSVRRRKTLWLPLCLTSTNPARINLVSTSRAE